MVVLRAPTCFVLRDASLAALLGDPDVLLPLPFTALADPADVLAHLQRLTRAERGRASNPHRTVHFEPLPLHDNGTPGLAARAFPPLPAGRSGPGSPGPLAP